MSSALQPYAFRWLNKRFGAYGENIRIRFSLFSVVRFRNILLPPYSPLQPLHHPSSLAKSLPIQRPVLTDREDSNARARPSMVAVRGALRCAGFLFSRSVNPRTAATFLFDSRER